MSQYLAIVGYGIVVPIDHFSSVFPDNTFSEIEDHYKVSLHGDITSSKIFISSTKYLKQDVGGYDIIGQAYLSSQKEYKDLYTFVKQFFPDQLILMTLFTYQKNIDLLM